MACGHVCGTVSWLLGCGKAQPMWATLFPIQRAMDYIRVEKASWAQASLHLPISALDYRCDVTSCLEPLLLSLSCSDILSPGTGSSKPSLPEFFFTGATEVKLEYLGKLSHHCIKHWEFLRLSLWKLPAISEGFGLTNWDFVFELALTGAKIKCALCRDEQWRASFSCLQMWTLVNLKVWFVEDSLRTASWTGQPEA